MNTNSIINAVDPVNP